MDSVQKDSDREIFKQEKVKGEYTFSTCACVSGKIFSFTNFKRVPIMVDMDTEKINVLDDLINYDPSFVADHMISIERNIFVLEINGNRLMHYNIDDRNCRYFNIGCKKKLWDNYAAFTKYGTALYVFPIYTDKIVKVDIGTEQVKKFGKLYSQIHNQNKHLEYEENFTYFVCGCQMRNIMWLFRKRSNAVIAYNMEDDTWKEYKILKEICNCIDAVYRNHMIYILDSAGKVYCWNMVDESAELLFDCSSVKSEVNIFSRIIVTDKKIFVLPSLGKDIFSVDMYTKRMEKYDRYPMGFRYFEPEGWSKYHGYCEDNEYYYFAMRSTEFILLVNKRNGKLKWIKIKPPLYSDYLKTYMKYNKNMVSETVYGPNDLLAFIHTCIIENYKGINFLAGNYIWEQMKTL